MVREGIEYVEGGFVYNGYRAELLGDQLAGGLGGIVNPDRPIEDNHRLVATAIDSFVPAEEGYTLCIGGRKPTETNDHVPVRARDQLAGNNTITSLFVAEASAASFYEDPSAPFDQRLDFLLTGMIDRGEIPSAHVGCAARQSLLAVFANILRLGNATDETGDLFRTRLIESLDGTVDDPMTRMTNILRRLEARYELLTKEFNPEYVIAKVREHSPHGVNDLIAEQNPTHGHHEEVVIRERTDMAVSPVLFHRHNQGRQAFVLAEDRLTSMTRGMCEDPVEADEHQVAGNMFTDGVLTTISRNLPTYRITKL